ncbi:MAG: hypothetical protein JWR53_1981 [Glaciihabitans sp.]|jgi:hypothetical protein|nr:hypothetical protein [Glaciihabitans sp.]
MSLIAPLAAEAATYPMLMPPIGFALIAFTVFLFLGVVTWTYRDVAHRHSQRLTKGGATEHHNAGH